MRARETADNATPAVWKDGNAFAHLPAATTIARSVEPSGHVRGCCPRLSDATPWISIAKMVKNVLELAASYKECRSVLPKLGDAASAKQRPVALRGAVQP